jgi:lysine N6-hydroxylase
MEEKIYDVIGVGIGPFSLGLAAILDDIPEMKTLFLDERKEFNFHAGLLLPSARMQVPYFADLITVLNPQSKFTFHKFLHEEKRFFRFANQENNYPLRVEYNEYMRWAVKQLPNLLFDQCVRKIAYARQSNIYIVRTDTNKYYARHIVLGIGEQPWMPECLSGFKAKYSVTSDALVIHSASYLDNKPLIDQANNITIIGSGQSAAEIFLDLLPRANDIGSLNWFTRASRFHPMEVSKFTTEMTSSSYIDHFYGLSSEFREKVLTGQQYLFKGINAGLLEQINEALYIRMINGGKNNVCIAPNMELVDSTRLQKGGKLIFRHLETSEKIEYKTDMVIAATGYRYGEPCCLADINYLIKRDEAGRFLLNRDHSIDDNQSIFVQNAELHTHGFNSADLALGPYRNAEIINSILKMEYFALEKDTGFQNFSLI